MLSCERVSPVVDNAGMKVTVGRDVTVHVVGLQLGGCSNAVSAWRVELLQHSMALPWGITTSRAITPRSRAFSQ